MKRLLGFLVSLGLGVALFWGVGQSVGWQEIGVTLASFSGTKGLSLILLTLAVLLTGTLRWKEVLHSQGYQFSFLFLFRSYLGGFALSFFAPMVLFGNEVFRAYSLEAAKGVPFPKALPSAVIERILESTVYLVIVLLGLSFLIVSDVVALSLFFWWILLFVLVLVSFLVFFYIKSFRKESLVRMFFPRLKKTNGVLEVEREVLRFFRLGNKALWEGLALSFVKGAATLLRTMILGLFLGKFLGLFPTLAVTGFSLLALLLPIPGQLGSHEVLQALGFQALGLGASSGVAFAFLIRAAEFLVAFAGLFFLARVSLLIFKNLVFQRMGKLFQGNT